jgi:hypothetical protein
VLHRRLHARARATDDGDLSDTIEVAQCHVASRGWECRNESRISQCLSHHPLHIKRAEDDGSGRPGQWIRDVGWRRLWTLFSHVSGTIVGTAPHATSVAADAPD